MQSVSFIHCADTHLGKIQQNLAQRFEDFLNSFNNLVDYAINEKVDFIIVAGDFFDKRNINPDTFSRTYGILKKLKKYNIPLIACEGNHDKTFYGNKLSWMETLAEIGYIILLKPDYDDKGDIIYTAWNENNKRGFYYDVTDEIRIFGLGYFGPEANNRLEEIAPFLSESKNNYNKFNILLLHGIIKKYQSDFIGTISSETVNNLKNYCDYIALGHQHTRYAHENFAFNPGSLEYWDIGEVKHKPEDKGFYHVHIGENGRYDYSYKPSFKRHAIYLQIDISETRNPEEVYALINSKLEKAIGEGDSPIIQIILRGTLTYDMMEIDIKFIKAMILEEFNPVLVDISTERMQFAGQSGNRISQCRDIKEIEREVIMNCVEQSARFEGDENKLTDLILEVMSLASADEKNEDEIYKALVNCGVEKKEIELKIGGGEKVVDEIEIEKTAVTGQKSILDFG